MDVAFVCIFELVTFECCVWSLGGFCCLFTSSFVFLALTVLIRVSSVSVFVCVTKTDEANGVRGGLVASFQ